MNLTGAAVTGALAALVGINSALLVRLFRVGDLTFGARRGSGLVATALPTLVPNLGCCAGLPLLAGLLPGGLGGVGVTLGMNYGLVMTGVIVALLGATLFMMRTVHRSQTRIAGCDLLGGVRGGGIDHE